MKEVEVADIEVASIGTVVASGKVMGIMTNAAEFHYLLNLWDYCNVQERRKG